MKFKKLAALAVSAMLMAAQQAAVLVMELLSKLVLMKAVLLVLTVI